MDVAIEPSLLGLSSKGHYHRKSEIRNTKSETNSKHKIQIQNDDVPSFWFRISLFGFVSDFDIRISDFSFGNR